MSADALIEYLDDPTLTKSLISRYEGGHVLPTKARLANMLAACKARITPEIDAHYANVMEDGGHMGQVNPGGRTRVAAAKKLIAAWQKADNVQDFADAVGLDRQTAYAKISNLRVRGVPLKKMILEKDDYAMLAEFARSIPLDNQEQP